MSLRSYLFSLIGGLIVLLTLAQLFLVHWIEQTLMEEVNHKAKFLSQQMIELVFDEIENNDLEQGTHKIITTSIGESHQNIEVKVINNKIKIHASNVKKIKLPHIETLDILNSDTQTKISKHLLTKELKTLFDTFR